MDMPKPQEIPALFLQAMNAGDVDAVVSLYESEGVIATDGSQIVAGHDAIRSMVSRFLAQKPRFTLHASDAVQAGDLALIRSRWTVALADSAGKQREVHVGPTLVLRRGPDSQWHVVIDRPAPDAATGAAIPILPAMDLEGTRTFFERLGFTARYWSPKQERGYAILTRGNLELHFFSYAELARVSNYAGCYWRVTDANALHAEYSALGLPARGAPSVGAIEDKPWGMREFELVDPNGNLIRIGQDRDA
jgi:uncharacterized protein (TIGR02246 family)